MQELVNSLEVLVRLYSSRDVAVELGPKLQTAMDVVIQAMQNKTQQNNRKSMLGCPDCEGTGYISECAVFGEDDEYEQDFDC